MSRLPDPVSGKTLTASSVEQFAAGENERITITAATVSNNSGTSRWITVTKVAESGATPTNLSFQVQVPPNQDFTLYGVLGHTVKNGGSMSALAETAGVLDLTLSGIVVTGNN